MKQQFIENPEKKWQKGMTLIELIVVVTIVLLLLIALYRNVNNHVAKARDADRKKDLQTIKVAFENYYNDKGCYPPEGSLEDCGSVALDPWLKQIPCDELGQPYLYLPVNDESGHPCAGYRVLTQLTVLNDPMIKKVGCPGGCGVPLGIEHPERYNYGIAEGVALNQNNVYIAPTISIIEYCENVSNACYCCPAPGDGCNLYNPATPETCNDGPFATLGECQAAGCI